MNIKKQMIWVRFQKEGIHKYPDALINPDLSDVEFLGYPHRHIFHFKVGIEVKHDDRDVEFILFKRWLESIYDDRTLELNYKSCEMISNDLVDVINNTYPNRDINISVSEDNENGSFTEYTNDVE
jgi:hypothetical protein